MTKLELVRKTDENIEQTRFALQTVYDALNKGQRQKLLKNEEIKVLFDRYGVIYEEGKK